MRSVLISIALLACGGDKKGSSSAVEAPPVKQPCISPLAHGAVPDDNRDDRAAIQAAIDEAESRGGGTVCLPAGDFHIGREPNRIASLLFSKTGVTLAGEGPTTQLRMLDLPDDVDMRDWWVIQVTGSNHVLRDFALDGADRGITDEQTHLIQVRGPATRIRLEGLHLAMPVQETSRGGDCIRLLGDPNELVHDVVIRDVHGSECARSFIAFQRLVTKVLVERVTSSEVGGQSIDMEPSGNGAIEDVVIRESTLRRGSLAKGGVTVALSGSSTVPSKNLVVEDSLIEAGIQVYRVHGVKIQYNRLFGGVQDKPMIRVHQDSRRIRIESNIIDRQRGSGGGIEFFSHNDGWPTDVLVRNNEITMHTEGFPIHGEPVQNIEIRDNTITCRSEGTKFDAVFLRGVKVAIKDARVRANHIRGNCSAAVRIGQYAENVTGATVVEDNIVEGARFGVLFENGPPSVRPIINRNLFKGVQGVDHVRGSTQHGFVGENRER